MSVEPTVDPILIESRKVLNFLGLCLMLHFVIISLLVHRFIVARPKKLDFSTMIFLELLDLFIVISHENVDDVLVMLDKLNICVTCLPGSTTSLCSWA